jgi:hypothetical protein
MDYLDETDDVNLSINIEIDKYNRLKIKSDESIQKILNIIDFRMKEIISPLSPWKSQIEQIKFEITHLEDCITMLNKEPDESPTQNGYASGSKYCRLSNCNEQLRIKQQNLIHPVEQYGLLDIKIQPKINKINNFKQFLETITKYTSREVYTEILNFEEYFKGMFTYDNQCIIQTIQQKALIYEKLKHKTLEKENAELKIRLNDMDEKLKLLTTSKFM